MPFAAAPCGGLTCISQGPISHLGDHSAQCPPGHSHDRVVDLILSSSPHDLLTAVPFVAVIDTE